MFGGCDILNKRQVIDRNDSGDFSRPSREISIERHEDHNDDGNQFSGRGPMAHYQHISRIMDRKYYVKLFILGMIIIFVGSLLNYFPGYMVAPDRDDYDEDDKGFEEDVDYYNMIKNSLTTTGQIIKLFGMVAISIAIFICGIFDEKLHPYVRLGIFIALGLILAFNF